MSFSMDEWKKLGYGFKSGQTNQKYKTVLNELNVIETEIKTTRLTDGFDFAQLLQMKTLTHVYVTRMVDLFRNKSAKTYGLS